MKRTITMICLIVILCLYLTGCKSDDYDLAVTLQDAGAYAAALEVYTNLGDYRDAAERIAECENAIAQIEAQNAAEAEYEEAAQALIDRNSSLETAIESAEAALGSGEPLDPTLSMALEQIVSTAKELFTPPIYAPRDIDSLKAAAAQMNGIDYDATVTLLQEQAALVERSVVLFTLVNNPSEEYIIKCLEKVSGVTGIAAATEDNDPNHKLNKDGGYTAAVFFTHEFISATAYSGDTILSKATTGGGCLEVYRTVEDAESRNSYLAAFDGTALDSGSHAVVGTIVVRTSCKMTASQQDELEAEIISALLPIEE